MKTVKKENILLSSLIKALDAKTLARIVELILFKNTGEIYKVEIIDNNKGVFQVTGITGSESGAVYVFGREEMIDNVINGIWVELYGGCLGSLLWERKLDLKVNATIIEKKEDVIGLYIEIEDSGKLMNVMSLMACGKVNLEDTKKVFITENNIYTGKEAKEKFEEMFKIKKEYNISFYLSTGHNKPVKVETVAILKTPEDSYLDESLCGKEEVSDMEEAISYLLDKLKGLPDNVMELTLSIEGLCPYKSYKAITDISIAAVKHYPNILIKSEYSKRSENENI
jgi:hypothetical protein